MEKNINWATTELIERNIFHAANPCGGVGSGRMGGRELPSFHLRDLEKFFLVCFEWPWKNNLSHK